MSLRDAYWIDVIEVREKKYGRQLNLQFFTKCGEFIDEPSNCQLLRMVSAP